MNLDSLPLSLVHARPFKITNWKIDHDTPPRPQTSLSVLSLSLSHKTKLSNHKTMKPFIATSPRPTITWNHPRTNTFHYISSRNTAAIQARWDFPIYTVSCTLKDGPIPYYDTLVSQSPPSGLVVKPGRHLPNDQPSISTFFYLNYNAQSDHGSSMTDTYALCTC